MVDLSHEPRWGRIAEGGGEDPYLGSVMAAARVHGAQGDDYSALDKVVTSPKHFAAYGQPEGGRDYNTTDMSEQRLWSLYLPPFEAAIDAGADTSMCSFNAINGVPGCGNPHTLTDILKRTWNFDGFVESDYTAVAEMRACPPKNPDTGPCGHGVAADGPDAGALALNSGVDSEMVSTNIRDFGKQLLAQHKISMSRINDAVRRILRVKVRAGLFEHPYADQSKIPGQTLTPDDRKAAREGAGKSMVLLKNDDGTLPLDPNKSVAVIGPLGNDQHDMLGPWWGQGQDADAISPYTGIKAQDQNTTFTAGCTMSNSELADPEHECATDAAFDAAVEAANAADQVVLALGETREMSGEAESRSNIDLPGLQHELIDRIKATGKPLVVVLFNGRPLTLSKVADSAPAILKAWFPGKRQAAAGAASIDVRSAGSSSVVGAQRRGERGGGAHRAGEHERRSRPGRVGDRASRRAPAEVAGGRGDGDLDRAEDGADHDQDGDERAHGGRAQRAAAAALRGRRTPGARGGLDGKGGGGDDEDRAGCGQRGSGRPRRADQEDERRPGDPGELARRGLRGVGGADGLGVAEQRGEQRAHAGADRRRGQPEHGGEGDERGQRGAWGAAVAARTAPATSAPVSRTAVWPRRSTSRPRSGPPTPSATPKVPATTPAAANEPVRRCVCTSSPMLNTVSGRRATMETAKRRRAPGVERMASMARRA
jgi:beta-glucosidase-like glycosyl hydrolase